MSSTEEKGLQVRTPEQLAGHQIKSPADFALRMREMAEHAHVLSPAMAVSHLPEGIVINTAVVVIDARVNGDGVGTDVYFQKAIHKSHNAGTRDDAQWVPDEVSLSKVGLLKILSAAGVKVTRSERTDAGDKNNYWSWSTEGTITDFDGQIRPLPPGNVEIDLRDGSAQIGEWTPAKWDERVRAADEKKKSLPSKDQWKARPEPIDGWSRDRVMQARKAGLRLAEAKSLTAFMRNLGIKQKYTVKELDKPFVIFRPTFLPDMSDPAVRHMVTAAHLGASSRLYAPQLGTSLPHAHGDVIDTTAVHRPAEGEVVDAELETAAAPEGATEANFDDPATVVEDEQSFIVTKISQLQADYFIETKEQTTFVTADRDTAKALNDARKSGQLMAIEGDAIVLDNKRYLRITNVQPAAATKAGAKLPDPSKL